VTVATGFKRLGFAVAAIVLLGLGALAAMSLLISRDRVRESVQAEIRNATGLDLTLRGGASVSLFPTGSVSFADVVLAEEGAREPALATERLTARLRLLPLFAGRIEIADIALEQPQINLVLASDGSSNWSGLIASLARARGPKANRAEDDASFSAIGLRGGTITIRDGARETAETLTGVNLAIAWPSIAKSLAATGRVVWHGEPVDVNISLSDFPSALAGDQTGLKIRLGGAPGKLVFEGTMSARPTLKIDGTVSADSTSLRDALRWAGQKPLPGNGFGRFALKAKTSIAGGTIALTGVNVSLDGNSAEGVFSFAADGRQTLQGTLAANDLDLTPYVSAVRLVTGNERDWAEFPIALDGLNGFDVDLRLSAAKVSLGRVKIGHTAVTANLRGGRLMLSVGESAAFGGLVRGSFVLASTDGGAEIKSQMQFVDVDLENSLGEMFNIRQIEGRGNLNIAIETAGNSIFAMTQNLNGSVNLAGRDGGIARLNAEQTLIRIKRQPLSGFRDYRNGRTPFEKLIVNLKVAQGIARIDEARLEGPRLRITLTGASAVPSRELDLRGTASLFENGKGEGVSPSLELVFAVRGTWEEPIPILADTQFLLESSQSLGPMRDDILKRRNLREPAPAAAAPASPAANGSDTNGAVAPATPAGTEPASTAPAAPAAPQQ
jgi:AsmA protein